MYSQQFQSASASKEADFEMVAFGAASDGTNDYVLLQMADEFDDQDRSAGMDGIYLEINDQAHSDYKAVSRVEVFLNVVIIHFASEQLDLPHTFDPLCIRLDGGIHFGADVREMLVSMAHRAEIGIESTPIVY
ncbi:Imm10 family immunity protein [Tritonibacter mobilis]|nr:Imm10 family immunity protein [Tritonibacter mobilis]